MKSRLTFKAEFLHGIGLGAAFGNLQPKSKYETAQWSFHLIILCFGFQFDYMYNYKKTLNK